MNINLDLAAGLVGAMTTIVAPVAWLTRKTMRAIDQLNRNTADMCAVRDENKILIRGLLACLKGLHEQGVNGPVTAGIEEIENYLINSNHSNHHRKEGV